MGWWLLCTHKYWVGHLVDFVVLLFETCMLDLTALHKATANVLEDVGRIGKLQTSKSLNFTALSILSIHRAYLAKQQVIWRHCYWPNEPGSARAYLANQQIMWLHCSERTEPTQRLLWNLQLVKSDLCGIVWVWQHKIAFANALLRSFRFWRVHDERRIAFEICHFVIGSLGTASTETD